MQIQCIFILNTCEVSWKSHNIFHLNFTKFQKQNSRIVHHNFFITLKSDSDLGRRDVQVECDTPSCWSTYVGKVSSRFLKLRPRQEIRRYRRDIFDNNICMQHVQFGGIKSLSVNLPQWTVEVACVSHWLFGSVTLASGWLSTYCLLVLTSGHWPQNLALN